MSEPTAANTWQPREHDRLCPAFGSCGYCDAPGDYTEPRKLGTPQGVIVVPMRPVCLFGECECECAFIAEIRDDQVERDADLVRDFGWSPETDDADIAQVIADLREARNL